ncbi:hypothetical protein [Haloarcula litorea]|uniref:DUF7836 family putative zinc-binding protein n=1 Tax=Haloarcula litorea TaxID=3032579 RepID=UPI0023E815F2|nr:hypothetical protein [Halomicroarcula sp. GDY20]
MQEAWIELQCPDCGETWEEQPSELPAPDSSFDCAECGSTHRLAEFMKTSRDLEVLEQFH